MSMKIGSPSSPATQTHILHPERLVVAARRDLRVSTRHDRGELFYFVEDPLRNKFFRLGKAEHALFLALDGTRTLAEAAAHTASASGSQALTQDEAVLLGEWLVRSGLASSDIGLASRSPTMSQVPTRHDRWNLWSFRITLGSPDRALETLDPFGRFLFGRTFLVLWFAILAAALLQALTAWPMLAKNSPIDWGWQGALSLFAAWCGLKILHELAHAIACRRFGGNVGNVGLAFVLGMPSPFVDVSTICRVPDKWKRIVVSLAGIYIEIFVAALAMIAWSAFEDPLVRQGALAVVWAAGIGSVIFNLNPLMRFDGYFALSDAMEMPNLSAVGQEESWRLLRRFLFGIDEAEISAKGRRPAWVAWYGIAAMLWRTFVLGSLLLLAIAKLGAFGTIFISIPLFLAWLAKRRTLRRSLIRGGANVGRNRQRQAATCTALGLLSAILFYCLDPSTKELAAVVDYEPLEVVRAGTAGFVRQVFVCDGEQVFAGRKIAELDNAELLAEIGQVELAIEQSTIRSRMHRQAKTTSKEQTERLQRQVLETELRELHHQREGLTIVAATDGTIVSRGIDRYVGLRLEKGDEIASIAGDSAKTLKIAVPQRLVTAIANAEDRTADVLIHGHRKPVSIRLATCDPQASTRLIHPAMSVEHGGMLSIRRREATPDEAGEGKSRNRRDTTIAETVEPCFQMTARADEETLRDVAAGRTAIVKVRIPWRSALHDYWSRSSAWLHHPQAE
ncbi:MAG: hypothetical protein K8U03_10225 [Planctomycetia bacterium]|nr:hypothetical protein [Planctomycetia bacterium]